MAEQSPEEFVIDILSSHVNSPGQLLPILLDVQHKVGYLPEGGIQAIAEFLVIDVGEIYSVASFYSQFRLTPIGKYHVQVCRGTACHIRGAPRILEELENQTGISEGETSSDMKYTLETVACMGCCALAPAIKVNNNVHGELTTRKADEVMHSLPEEETDDS
ncbi:MAG TPA: NADH-quinone oxidoreductase subunit NuoE [Dehalococcoidales bacterium]|nr:NADH-quinone oxidoreductase subunit NuoE [Dehalococcoidales bacterium]